MPQMSPSGDAGALEAAAKAPWAIAPRIQPRSDDRMLMLVRCAVALGLAVWTASAPVAKLVRVHCALLLGVFLAYSAVLFWCVSRWPRRRRGIHLAALVADLALLFFLFRETGGVSSPFLPAAFMLSALTAFHCPPEWF